MPESGVSLEVRGLKEAVADLGKVSLEATKAMEGVITWGTRYFERETRKAAGKKARVRTGRYRSSIAARFDDPLTGVVGTDVIYAAILEFGTRDLPGGRLRPKAAKFLAIPLGDAKTAAGVPRKPADYYDTFVRKSKRTGKLLIWGSKDVLNPDPRPLFVLVKSVEIKGRYIFAEVEKTGRPVIMKRMEDAIGKVTDG